MIFSPFVITLLNVFISITLIVCSLLVLIFFGLVVKFAYNSYRNFNEENELEEDIEEGDYNQSNNQILDNQKNIENVLSHNLMRDMNQIRSRRYNNLLLNDSDQLKWKENLKKILLKEKEELELSKNKESK